MHHRSTDRVVSHCCLETVCAIIASVVVVVLAAIHQLTSQPSELNKVETTFIGCICASPPCGLTPPFPVSSNPFPSTRSGQHSTPSLTKPSQNDSPRNNNFLQTKFPSLHCTNRWPPGSLDFPFLSFPLFHRMRRHRQDLDIVNCTLHRSVLSLDGLGDFWDGSAYLPSCRRSDWFHHQGIPGPINCWK